MAAPTRSLVCNNSGSGACCKLESPERIVWRQQILVISRNVLDTCQGTASEWLSVSGLSAFASQVAAEPRARQLYLDLRPKSLEKADWPKWWLSRTAAATCFSVSHGWQSLQKGRTKGQSDLPNPGSRERPSCISVELSIKGGATIAVVKPVGSGCIRQAEMQ